MELLRNGADRAVIALWLGHESVGTPYVHLHADLKLEEAGTAKASSAEDVPARYQPTDEQLAFLESLRLFRVKGAEKHGLRLS